MIYKVLRKSDSMFLLSFCIGYIMLLLIFPGASAEGVNSGLQLCFGVLIPSLYPFLVSSSVFIKTGVIDKVRNKGIAMLILSLLGGYPVGAKSVVSLVESGNMGKAEAKKILSFCVTPSVSFVIFTVGSTFLNNLKAGIIILAAIILSSISICLIKSLICKKRDPHNAYIKSMSESDFSSVFVSSVKDGLMTIITICGFVVFFSSIISIIESIVINEKAMLFIKCILEVTCGAEVAAENYSVIFLSALISFGGICTIFQLRSILINIDLTFFEILVSRIISASISAFYTSVLLKIFPISSETFNTAAFKIASAPSNSNAVSICLVLMSVLFIMGNSVITKNTLTEKANESKIFDNESARRF